MGCRCVDWNQLAHSRIRGNKCEHNNESSVSMKLMFLLINWVTVNVLQKFEVLLDHVCNHESA
jgi:hypothetical protein